MGVMNDELRKELETLFEGRLRELLDPVSDRVGSVEKKMKDLEEFFRKQVVTKDDKGKLLEAQRKTMKLISGLFRGAVPDEVKDLATSDWPAVVPSEYSNQIIYFAEQYGIVRKYATRIPMRKATIYFPSITGGLTAYWVDEGQAITPSDFTGDQIAVNAKKLAALVVATSELFDDADVSVMNVIAMLAGEAFAYAEDYSAFFGGGGMTGLLQEAGIGVTTLSTSDITGLNADIIRETPYKIPGKHMRIAGARWYMHRTVFAYIKNMKDSAGHYVWDETSKALAGYPVELVEWMPSASAGADSVVAVFGNLKFLYYGDRKTLQVDVSKEGVVGSTNLFTQDKQAVRFIERFGFKTVAPDAFHVIKTASV